MCIHYSTVLGLKISIIYIPVINVFVENGFPCEIILSNKSAL